MFYPSHDSVVLLLVQFARGDWVEQSSHYLLSNLIFVSQSLYFKVFQSCILTWPHIWDIHGMLCSEGVYYSIRSMFRFQLLRLVAESEAWDWAEVVAQRGFLLHHRVFRISDGAVPVAGGRSLMPQRCL